MNRPTEGAVKPLMIAVTGGIGSGKSVVCRILSSLGYPVYDCDSRAKALMDASDEIKAVLVKDITPSAVNPDGSVDRKAVAAEVFSNPTKLAVLERLAHSAVKTDIAEWRDALMAKYSTDLNGGGSRELPGPRLFFVETAIPFKSGLHEIVDDMWEVTAPEDIRVARAAARDNADAESIRRRMAAQMAESPSARAAAGTDSPVVGYRTIANDGTTPLLPSILRLLSRYDSHGTVKG